MKKWRDDFINLRHPLSNIFIEIRTIRVGVGRSSSHAKSPSYIRIYYVECSLYRDVIRACNRRTNIVMLDSSYHQPLTSKCQRSLVFFLEGPRCRIESIDVFVFTPLPKNVSSLSLSRTAINSLIVLNTQYFTLRTASPKPRFSKGLQREDQRGSQSSQNGFRSVFGP